MDVTHDVVVIGGGAAGLSAGLVLARSRRTVAVVDAGEPRNAPADGVHNYLGREGIAPGELVTAGRAEVAGYGGEIVDGRVVATRRLDGPEAAFAVTLDGGRELTARRLVVATGLVDELPDVDGLATRWGHDVIHCPYCHGWEVRDRAIAVLATGPMSIHQTLLLRQLSADVTFLRHTAPDPTDEEWEQLAARGIAVVDGEVAALEVVDDRLTGVRLRSGHVIACDALAVATRVAPRTDGLAGLGLDLAEVRMGEHVLGTTLAADPNGATSVAGVWVAGNAADMRATVVDSASAGVRAGAIANADLVTEDTARAVAARRLVGVAS